MDEKQKAAVQELKAATHCTPEMCCCLCDIICDLDARVTALEANIITPESHKGHKKHEAHDEAHESHTKKSHH